MTTSTLTWIAPVDKYLSTSQRMNNAQLVANHFKGTDWTREAIAALCGNMSHESTLNPNLYEQGYGHSPSRGYGLVQWTPATKLWDWCNSRSLDWKNGDSQLARIDYEVEQNIQWIPKASIDYMTFQEFRTNAKGWDVRRLTEAFTWGYERPSTTAGNASMPARQDFAVKCLAELDWEGTGIGWDGGEDGVTPRPNKQPTKAPQYKYAKAGTWNKMTYVQVKPGDSLSKIAAKHGVSMNGIKRVSFSEIKKKNEIKVGEILILPKK